MKQQSTDRHIAPLGHIVLIPRQAFSALNDCAYREAIIYSFI